MLLAELVLTSRQVGETRARLKKIGHLTDLLVRLAPEEVEIGVAFLSGVIPGGSIAVGRALLAAARPGSAAKEPGLQLRQVHGELHTLASIEGPGSRSERTRCLQELLTRSTAEEQDFLGRLLLGELRQGALAGVMVEAVARAAEVPVDEVRRAVMLAGDLTVAARAALNEGVAGLRRFRLEVFRPVLPMLAQPAKDVADVLEHLERAGLEFKLDGARVQVHKSGDEVRVFTRRLNEVTAAVPEIVAATRALPARELILDGEGIALQPDGRPHPFQVTMRRFGRKLDVEKVRAELPLHVFFFDLLQRDGETLLDEPADRRFAALADSVPGSLLVPRRVTVRREEAEEFLTEALRRGHEGIMAKALEASYEAGGRGRSWLKVKPVHTLDLVVLAAEWGSGRRRGRLSNLHLGARDPAGDGFVMLGKTFKGLTDEVLAWQTEKLLELEVARDRYTVYVRPELVVEIAVNELQVSRQYPGGLALRFARVKRYRTDKRARDADTMATVRAIHEGRG